ncbi:hypothetical protein ZV82_002104, partial [Salmonella enterica subsp. enterica]|nr:hypothetical protein [Salmonella enterica subsp. enterica]
ANLYTDNKITDATINITNDMKEYTDNSSKQTLIDANSYTDNSVNEAKTEMTEYVDSSSKTTYDRSVDYTDSKITEGNNYAIDISKSYTDQSSKNTLNQTTTYTDNKFNDAISYTDSQINTVNNRVDNLSDKVNDNRKRASAGIAGAMAMSSIPQNLSYDFNFGMGMANFDSEQAISAGSYYRINERTIVSVKASFDTQNNLGAAAGVSYGW